MVLQPRMTAARTGRPTIRTMAKHSVGAASVFTFGEHGAGAAGTAWADASRALTSHRPDAACCCRTGNKIPGTDMLGEQMTLGWEAAKPTDQNSRYLINATDRHAGIVDRRRNGAQGNVYDLDHAELDVLLERAHRADVEGPGQLHRRGRDRAGYAVKP